MLRALSLRDFVIVDRLELEFASGFTALTGETGAGKSILVDALYLALGARADAAAIRAGAERAEVAAEFDLGSLQTVREWLAANDFDDEEGACVLRRTVDRSGRSRGFVNGRPATAAQLRELGEALVGIHGQHEHQRLGERNHQRALLDAYAGCEELAAQTAARHGEWRRAVEARQAREASEEASAREREELSVEISDLEALAFSPEKWAGEEADHRRLAHAEALIARAREALDVLDDAEASAASLLARAATLLGEAARVDPALEDVRLTAASAAVHADEAAHALRHYLDKLELDPARLATLERRLRAVHDSARRFRVEPAGLVAALESRRARLEALGGAESPEALRVREAALERAYLADAKRLSEMRREAGKHFGEEVSATLARLAMEGGRLAVVRETLAVPASTGLESVEFHVAAHAGQPLGPIGRVASGGELSRLSLAIQVLMGGRAAVPTLVFDEVDAGIGGRVAEITGSLLAAAARHHQVLCVTHLAQVAAHARHQVSVEKRAGAKGTLATARTLDADERVGEIARMLGGARITETTRKHAAEMLQNAHAAGLTAGDGKARKDGRKAAAGRA